MNVRTTEEARDKKALSCQGLCRTQGLCRVCAGDPDTMFHVNALCVLLENKADETWKKIATIKFIE